MAIFLRPILRYWVRHDIIDSNHFPHGVVLFNQSEGRCYHGPLVERLHSSTISLASLQSCTYVHDVIVVLKATGTIGHALLLRSLNIARDRVGRDQIPTF